MDKSLFDSINRFETIVEKLNQDRSVGPFRRLRVTVLGQHGLLIQKDKLSNIDLLATNDFDAFLNGEPPLEDIFKKTLRENGLTYDEKSEYIWLPEETRYSVIYESESIIVESPLPIYLIVSKAVKAPLKNKQLVSVCPENRFSESSFA